MLEDLNYMGKRFMVLERKKNLQKFLFLIMESWLFEDQQGNL